MKVRSMARRKRRERQQLLAKQRIETYMKLRSRRAQKVFQNFMVQFRQPQTVTCGVWSKPRSETWWDTVVERCFNDNDWIKNFRMSKTTFDFMWNELYPFLHREDTCFRQAISVRKRVAVALWRMATNSDYRTIGHLFGISKASVCLIADEFCNAVVDILQPKYIKIPVDEELDRVVNDFKYKWGFPQCVDAIDGSHIPVKAPIEFHADYYNQKGWYSVILQGVVDSSYKFIDINVGRPGKVHDARVFANSSLFHRGRAGSLFSEAKAQTINDVCVPLGIIADAANPLLPWVMKPFPDNGNLPPEKYHFNYRLSRARMVVENAFGRLKGSWCCLHKQNEVDIAKSTSVSATCCVLHNICEAFGENFDEEFIFEEDHPNINVAVNRNIRDAEHVRDTLVQYCHAFEF